MDKRVSWVCSLFPWDVCDAENKQCEATRICSWAGVTATSVKEDCCSAHQAENHLLSGKWARVWAQHFQERDTVSLLKTCSNLSTRNPKPNWRINVSAFNMSYTVTEVKVLNYPEHWPACSASQGVRGEGGGREGWRGVFSFWSRDLQQQPLLALKVALCSLCMAKRRMQKAPAAKRPTLRGGGGQKHGLGLKEDCGLRGAAELQEAERFIR